MAATGKGWRMSVSASGLAAERPTAEQSRKAIYAATIGNVMEWYDFGVFGYLATTMSLEAGQVAAWMSQAQYQAIQDRVAARDEDDGDRAARLLHRFGCRRAICQD